MQRIKQRISLSKIIPLAIFIGSVYYNYINFKAGLNTTYFLEKAEVSTNFVYQQLSDAQSSLVLQSNLLLLLLFLLFSLYSLDIFLKKKQLG